MGPHGGMRVGRQARIAGALLGVAAAATLVGNVVHGRLGSSRRVAEVAPSVIARFLADQAALDKTLDSDVTQQGLQEMEDTNLAQGDGLLAGMQEHHAAGRGALVGGGVDDSTAQALRAADGAIHAAGLYKNGRGELLGELTGSQLSSEMSDGGMPTAKDNAQVGESLKQELAASRRELADVAAGGTGSAYTASDMGLSESALNSVAEGMQDGLSAASVNPDTGLSSGSLALAPSSDAATLAARELRHVADGSMAASGTLTGLVGADDALSEALPETGPRPRAHLDDAVARRTQARLQQELKTRLAMVARLRALQGRRQGGALRPRRRQESSPPSPMAATAERATRADERSGSGALAGVQKRAASLLEAQVRARQRQLKLLEAARGAAGHAGGTWDGRRSGSVRGAPPLTRMLSTTHAPRRARIVH